MVAEFVVLSPACYQHAGLGPTFEVAHIEIAVDCQYCVYVLE